MRKDIDDNDDKIEAKVCIEKYGNEKIINVLFTSPLTAMHYFHAVPIEFPLKRLELRVLALDSMNKETFMLIEEKTYSNFKRREA